MHPLQDWLGISREERQNELRRFFIHPASSPRDYAWLVQVPNRWGVFASIGPHFRYAIFGRDSIETAEDLLSTHQELVHDIIISMCKLQGTKVDDRSEEEPGKIHHEYRARQFDGTTIPDESLQILKDLQERWGSLQAGEMTYYGSTDATPLFVRLVGRYVERYGAEILNRRLTRRTGEDVTVQVCATDAVHWIVDKLRANSNHMLAYKRKNPIGILNQVWKDSETSHLHEDGSLPNFNEPIVSLELQGYTYDALKAAQQLGLGTPAEREEWQQLARELQHNTISLLWMDDHQYFAQGYDTGPDGQPRQIRTITSEAGALLDSYLLHDLEPQAREIYIQAIVSVIRGDDMWTDIGIRCRSKKHWDLLNYIDYHGPNTVWPKETYDIAKGLRRSGYDDVAVKLEQGIRTCIEQAGDFTEFFYVSRDNEVWYDHQKALDHFGAESHGHSIPIPEPGQAWTVAAAIDIANHS